MFFFVGKGSCEKHSGLLLSLLRDNAPDDPFRVIFIELLKSSHCKQTNLDNASGVVSRFKHFYFFSS